MKNQASRFYSLHVLGKHEEFVAADFHSVDRQIRVPWAVELAALISAESERSQPAGALLENPAKPSILSGCLPASGGSVSETS